MKEFAALREKTYSYLTDIKDENKKGKGTKKCDIKIKFRFQNYKNCLEAVPLENNETLQKRNVTKENMTEHNLN